MARLDALERVLDLAEGNTPYANIPLEELTRSSNFRPSTAMTRVVRTGGVFDDWRPPQYEEMIPINQPHEQAQGEQ